MRRGRLPGLGLMICALAVAGCTEPTVVAPRAQRADVAVPSYQPPAGAPGFCALLADTTHLTEVPAALATLAANPKDVAAGLALSAAVDELQDVGDHVPVRAGYLAVGASIERLVTAIRRARDGRLTDEVRTTISTGLDDVGRQAQTVCGFPT